MATKKATKTVKKTTVKKPIAAKKSKKVVAKKVTFESVLTSAGKMFKAAKKPTVGALIAEFIGTFLLVASIIVLGGQTLTIGIAAIGVALIIGGVSGSHFNPIITIGAWVTRKISSLSAIAYLVAQAIGATAAYLVISSYIDVAKEVGASSASMMLNAAPITAGKEWYILIAELLGAFILVMGIAKAAKASKAGYAAIYGVATFVALAIAGTLAAIALQNSPYGLMQMGEMLTFLNPAMAFVANAITWDVWSISIYIVAPVVGGIAAFALSDLLAADTCDCADVKCNCK